MLSSTRPGLRANGKGRRGCCCGQLGVPGPLEKGDRNSSTYHDGPSRRRDQSGLDQRCEKLTCQCSNTTPFVRPAGLPGSATDLSSTPWPWRILCQVIGAAEKLQLLAAQCRLPRGWYLALSMSRLQKSGASSRSLAKSSDRKPHKISTSTPATPQSSQHCLLHKKTFIIGLACITAKPSQLGQSALRMVLLVHLSFEQRCVAMW